MREVKMVKIEEDPSNVEMRAILKNRDIIYKVLNDSQYCLFVEFTENDIFHGFLEKGENVTVKSKWPFIKPKEVNVFNRVANVVFELSTMTIYLTGDQEKLMDIAQKLEVAGYNVTIWT